MSVFFFAFDQFVFSAVKSFINMLKLLDGNMERAKKLFVKYFKYSIQHCTHYNVATWK